MDLKKVLGWSILVCLILSLFSITFLVFSKTQMTSLTEKIEVMGISGEQTIVSEDTPFVERVVIYSLISFIIITIILCITYFKIEKIKYRKEPSKKKNKKRG